MPVTILVEGQKDYIDAINNNFAAVGGGGGGGGSGTVTNVTGTSPISVATNTTTPVISMAAATASVNGYLTSADWTNFNSKLAGSYVPTWASITGKPTFATVATSGLYSDLLSKPVFSAQEEGTLLSSAVVTYNFIGAGVTATHAGGGVINVTIPGGGGSSITVKEEGTDITTALASLNFAGAGVTATNIGGAVTVTISGSAGISSTTDLAEGTNLYYTDTRVRSCVLTGLSLVTGTDIVAADSMLVAMGKIQKQITTNLATFTSHAGAGGAVHANAVAGGAAGFMTGADKTKLDAVTGTNTGDETTATIKTKLGISTLSGSNTGDQNTFTTIAVSGQSDVVADSVSDTLTLIAGTNITITTSAAGDSITINSSGGGGSSIAVSDEGVSLTTALTSLNFVGAGVTATNSTGAVTITIPQGLTALTGDVAASGAGSQAATIATNAVTFAKFQQVATARFLGRSTAGTGNVEELSTATVATMLGLSSTYSPIAGSGSITTVGTIGTGTWNANVISQTKGGTGVNNAGTITAPNNVNFSQAFTTSGGHAITFTTTGTTNISLPTSGTLVTTGANSTFTGTNVFNGNTAINGVQLAGYMEYFTQYNGTGSTATIPSISNVQIYQIGQNVTLTFPTTGGVRGRRFILAICQDNVGGWAITWPSSVKWMSGGSAPTPTTTPNKMDLYEWASLDAGQWQLIRFVPNLDQPGT